MVACASLTKLAARFRRMESSSDEKATVIRYENIQGNQHIAMQTLHKKQRKYTGQAGSCHKIGQVQVARKSKRREEEVAIEHSVVSNDSPLHSFPAHNKEFTSTPRNSRQGTSGSASAKKLTLRPPNRSKLCL
eukprot:Seg2041.5 transcript_id=Seg2041.5/GoldUCD/mRNA.D3Y31 product="hypothetical protein" protein_id=Seg2041.5/GoldUCD/D3Y31